MSPQTVWLASYPKSGNTWVRALLRAATGAGERALPDEHDDDVDDLDLSRLGHGPIGSARGVLERYTGLVASDLTLAEQRTLRPLADDALDAESRATRFRKIHDALPSGPDGASIVGLRATRGAVCIVRDPRDVAVSYARHCGRDTAWAVGGFANPGATMAGSTRRINSQFPQALGTWSSHVQGWLDHHLFAVLLVRYEDLHTAPERELERIAEFAELELSAAGVRRGVRCARFERLRRLEEEHGFAERPAAAERFFRRGIAGGWRDELARELADRVATDHADVMRRLGYSP